MARIAIGIEDVNRRGGQERVVCELLWRLADRHEIDLICFQAEEVPEQVRVVRVFDPGRFSLFLRALWFILPASWRAARERYDAVIAQGTNLLNPTHVLAHTCQAQRAQARREAQWKQHRPSWPVRLQFALRDGIVCALERRMVRRCRGRIIAVGDDPKQNLIRCHRLADADVVVAHNGVDHALFHPGLRDEWRSRMRSELGLSDGTFVPLFVGGRWEEKGLSWLIQALARMEHADTRLVVVGRGDEAEFGRQADALGVRDKVLFAGLTPHPERFCAMADCFAFLSETEGLALVQLEAAACGLPLVLAEGHAAPDLLEDGVSGFAVPLDPAIVAAKLDALAMDPAFRQCAGEETYRRSLLYSWDRQAKEIEGFVLRSMA
jgi:glycosyltransferase involved in cell wall biosynthesis